MSSAGCGASWPLLDAIERFSVLELTSPCPVFPSGLYPGTVQIPSSVEAAAGGRWPQAQATPTHGSAVRTAKPLHLLLKEASASLASSLPLSPLTDTH